VGEEDRKDGYEVKVEEAQDGGGTLITDYVEGKDVAWLGIPGRDLDTRKQEHLDAADAGVALLSKMFKEEYERVEEGKGVRTRSAHRGSRRPHRTCPERKKIRRGHAFTDQWISGGYAALSPHP